MNRGQFHSTVHLYLAILIAFFLPVARLVPLFIVLMLINWLIEGDFGNKFQLILKNKFSLLFISFYLLHLIGLLYTRNINSGLFDVQVKLSLLLFPLFLTSRPMEASKIRYVFIALILGCVVAGIIMLARAIYIHLITGENNFFYEGFASFLIHPGYSSMYINVAIAWLLLNVLNGQLYKGWFSNKVTVAVILFFSFIVVLLSSKMGFIILILMYVGFLIYYILNKKKYLFGSIGIILIAISIFALFRFVPELSERLDVAFKAVTKTNANQAEIESTAVRILVWKAANNIISENMFIGVGTGDAKDELMKEYKKKGMTGAIEHKLNAHNEYYQAFVALGLIGFLLLLISLFFPLWYSFKAHNVIYILFLLIIILNFLTESMLETQAGVMFYAFFNSLLCFRLNQTTNNKFTN
ncbi:MAG: O-antigen ligase family protein [Bacteroidota bacterium]